MKHNSKYKQKNLTTKRGALYMGYACTLPGSILKVPSGGLLPCSLPFTYFDLKIKYCLLNLLYFVSVKLCTITDMYK